MIGAQNITGVLGFREQLPQNMTRVGRDGPEESLVCIVDLVSDGLSITREEPLLRSRRTSLFSHVRS